MEIFAAIIIGIVVVMTVIDRAVYRPLVRAKNIENVPDIKRKRGMAETISALAIIVVIVLVFLAANG